MSTAKRLRPPIFFLAFAMLCHAGQTRTWTENEYTDFEKGHIKGLSLRSDGLITLAPRFEELFDSSSAYLWALAQDSKGNLYTGGGPGAKLYRISSKGEKKTLAELDGLEVHALAVDRNDRVYVATSPDGKVYRLSSDGKPEVFYEPKTKYIWALALDSKGNLFVATGDQGQIHRVTPDGKGSVFFRTDETHARSMAIDRSDHLIVGTDPGGLVMRVTPSGQGFVLYQMGKKEITAVAVANDGSIYASGVGGKQAAPALQPPAPVPIPQPSAPTAPGSPAGLRQAAPPPATLAGAGQISVSGGTEVYRIDAAGNPLKFWSHSQEIVYTIALDAAGRVLLGSGNKGYIYRVDSDTLYTALLNAPATQITALLPGAGGRIYAASGNVGKIYEIGPSLERQGAIESDVHDAGIFSQWGRLSFEGRPNGGSISIVARSGNLDRPERNWGPWSAPPVTDPKGARLNMPPARFAQWKATLTQSGGQSPELIEVDLAYLPKNIRPRIEEIESTPANYRFPAPLVSAISPPSLTLPALGKRARASASISASDTTPSMQYAKGYIGARWAASDDNGDSLVYKVEIRGVNEQEWKLLKDKVKERYLSWDSTAFPDGEYRIRVTASDLPSNPPQDALNAEAESDPFLVDNTPPRILSLAASRAGGGLVVRWKAADALNNIRRAEHSLDGGDWTVVAPVSKLSDSPELEYELKLSGVSGGEHTIAIRVEDDYENQATDKVVVRP